MRISSKGNIIAMSTMKSRAGNGPAFLSIYAQAAFLIYGFQDAPARFMIAVAVFL